MRKRTGRGESNLGTARSSLHIRKSRILRTGTTVTSREVKPKAKEKELQHVLLRGTIPDVVRWARERMDEECRSIASVKSQRAGSNTGACNARAFSQTITLNHNVEILLNGSISWKGETRLWENVCSFAAKLPDGGKANCIFDAMYRYPASLLVYYGLKPLFGRYVIVAGRRIPRLALRQNALTFFSSYGNEDSFAKKWFEENTLSRLQEIIIHMCGISEYVLRCVYMSKKMAIDEHDSQEKFLSFLDERIQEGHDHLHRRVLRFEPWDCLNELSVQHIAPCLESSLNIAHDAVIEGSKLSTRIYCQKEGNGRDRGRIKLWMIKRPLPEIMDCLIRKLEVNVCDVLGSDIDVDEFRLRVTRHLRRVEKIYEEVGDTWFRNNAEYVVPPEPPKKVKFLTLLNPYTFSFSRSL